MTNIFAYRATDPNVMRQQEDPVGPHNNLWLHLLANCSETAVVVAAWGTHGAYRNRGQEVIEFLPDLKCLRQTKEGHPSHPLYLPKNLKPIPLEKK